METLPPEKRAEVERLVDRLAMRTGTGPSSEPSLVERLRSRRERLFRTHGLYDTLPVIRELRENGR